MKHLSWIITVPLLVVAVIFAVANRQAVTLKLWPVMTIDAPVFIVVLLGLFIGFLAGASVMWLSGSAARSRARRNRYEVEHLRREIAHLERIRQNEPAAKAEQSGGRQLTSAG